VVEEYGKSEMVILTRRRGDAEHERGERQGLERAGRQRRVWVSLRTGRVGFWRENWVGGGGSWGLRVGEEADVEIFGCFD
jgi:hypothetical protein